MTQKPKPLHSIKVDGPIPAHLARSVIEETLRSAILDGRLPNACLLELFTDHGAGSQIRSTEPRVKPRVKR